MQIETKFRKRNKILRLIQDELKIKNPDGGFAVIKDETLLEVWLNCIDAIQATVEQYGNTSLLVKNITIAILHLLITAAP